MTITCRQLTESDWSLLRQVRLHALKNDPAVFGSTYSKESGYDEAKWRSWIANPDYGIWILQDGEMPIGMTGIGMDRDDPARQSCYIWGSWIEPAYRGRGLADLLYECRLEWARNHPTVTQVLASCRASNRASFRANQRHGFVHTHTVADAPWPDGGVEDKPYFKLAL